MKTNCDSQESTGIETIISARLADILSINRSSARLIVSKPTNSDNLEEVEDMRRGELATSKFMMK